MEIPLQRIAKITKENLLLKGMDEDYKRLILHKLQDDWSIKRLSRIFGLSEVVIQAVANEDKRSKSDLMKSRTTKKLPYKITSDHIIRAKEYLDKNWAAKITIQLLRNYLNRREDLENLSTTGVYYLLRRILKYSYKKAHRLPK